MTTVNAFLGYLSFSKLSKFLENTIMYLLESFPVPVIDILNEPVDNNSACV